MESHPLNAEIEDVLRRHRIGKKCRVKFLTLIHEGLITDADFRNRLHKINYETALYEILELMSRSYLHLFEPASFESFGVPNA